MASTLSSPVWTLNVSGVLTYGSSPAVLTAALNAKPTITILAGNTGPGYCDLTLTAALSITYGTPYVLDVYTGVDALGNSAVMQHVSGIVVINQSTTSGQNMVVGAGTHPLMGSDVWTILPGNSTSGPNAYAAWCPEWTVTSGSADKITITLASGTAVAGQIFVFGRST